MLCLGVSRNSVRALTADFGLSRDGEGRFLDCASAGLEARVVGRSARTPGQVTCIFDGAANSLSCGEKCSKVWCFSRHI